MMTSRIKTLAALAAATAATILAAAPARADDTELFVGPAVAAPPSRPNILFIMDTSGSMNNIVSTRPDYVPTTDYSAYSSCRTDRVYWSKTGTRPACNTNQWVALSSFTCNGALPSLNSSGLVSVPKVAQWKPNTAASNRPNNARWQQLTAGDNSNFIECAKDAGLHGSLAVPTPKTYAANGSNGAWSSDPLQKIDWAGGEPLPVTFYSGNYLNYAQSPTINRTRLQIVQSALSNLLDNLDNNVNVGLMRYSNDRNTLPNASDGGMVVQAMGRIEDNRAPMKATLNSWVASGSTPLSETLYEASLYFRGAPVFWGLTSDQCFQGQGSCPLALNPVSDTPSVPESRVTADQTLYDSPADADCQKNFIVYLTDGLPQSDSNSDATIQALPGFATINGYASCTGGPVLASDGDGTGQCLDELAKWMNESDMRPDRPGVQNVTSFWIGFGSSVAAGTDSLKLVAERGGGQYYAATDTAELTEAFTSIVSKILDQTTTFTSPTVAVNAFNRTQNLNYLYMSVFKPAASYRWLGNIKKYRITPSGEIRDVNNNAAVDPNNGFFRDSSRSYWSDQQDGANAEIGGAAGELKDPATRKIYSNLTANSGTLTEDLSALKQSGNLTLANQLLLGVASSVAVAGRPAVGDLVDWAYGYDVLDANGNNDVTEARKDMGDPLHSRPATVIYGGPADDPDITLYATTNDGFLQAITANHDIVAGTGGEERWSFVPRELLGRIEGLYDNEDVNSRNYGLDGAIKVVRLDRNGNGTIEPNGTDINGINGIEENEKDKVLLYFGMRRGGSRYYALDVTDRSAPKLLWSIGPTELPGIGQTWSAPAVARVNVNRTWSTSNPDKMVLVFGGGYDTAQDTVGYVADGVGNGIYMVDAITGSLIWRAGPTSSGAQLTLAKMTNSIPGDVRVVDLTGDGFADRMYAADMGGRVWRFDVRNGQSASNLVWGGVFAQLGAGELAAPKPAASNRRFFYAPDVALMKSGTVNFINIGIGSGHREKPITDQTVVNRFYSLRDFNMFTQVQNSQYKASCVSETSPCHQIITDDDSRLIDVTSDLTPTIASGDVGWKMNLQDTGEKVLAESRTFQNRIYFTTYSPQQRAYDPAQCVATVGLNRLYVVDATTAKPVVNFSDPTAPPTSVSDRSKTLAQGSIAPEAIFVFPTPDAIQGNPNPPAVPPICLVGLESCGSGLTNPPVRTYWQQRGTN